MQPSERRNPLARRQDEEIALAGDGNGQKELPISLIRRDGQTQPRDGMSEDVVTDYVAALADGVQFPPVDVMFDGTHYWLFDGFHRVETYLRSGRTAISARCYNGTLEEAQWRSYAANKNHGLRRSTADKERAIRAALRHAKAPGLSNVAIARHLGVDDKTVAKYRAEMVSTSEIPKSNERTGTDGRTINTANIGKAKPPKPKPTQPTPSARPLSDEETRHLVWRTIKAENEIAPGASSLFKWRKYLEWLGKHGEPRHYTIGLAANVRIDAITLATIIAAVATEISNNIAAVRVNEVQAVVEVVNEESPTVEAAVSELVELPAITGVSLPVRLTNIIEQARLLLADGFAADYEKLTDDYETVDEVDGLLKFMERAIKEAVYKGHDRRVK